MPAAEGKNGKPLGHGAGGDCALSWVAHATMNDYRHLQELKLPSTAT